MRLPWLAACALQKNMRLLLPVALLCTILLCSGCAQVGNSRLDSIANQSAAAHSGSFMVPESAVNYTAHYTLNENGAESYKTVWRAGRMMRIDLEGGVSLFFLSDRAYSCSSLSGTAQCFDISSAVGKEVVGGLFSAPDLSSAQLAEEVSIGGLAGKCYLMPSAPYETHKMCFTPDMLTAYDGYNGTAGKRTAEYLTELDYSVSPSDFALPAQPTHPPQN